MIKLVYFHGYGSQFDSSSDKIKQLKVLGEVFGCNIDYTEAASDVIQKAKEYVTEQKPDLVVGTSMGGWLASHIGAILGIPFVAINPALNPFDSLVDHVGRPTDYYDKPINLTQAVVDTYIPFNLNGCGLILLDEGDSRFDSFRTKNLLEDFYSVVTFYGGCHRFSHMKESIEHINSFLDKASLFYGVDSN